MDITIQMLDIDDTDEDGNEKVIHEWTAHLFSPTVCHPHRSRLRHSEVFGYSPSGYEWEELGLDKPTKFDPYAVTLSRQGLDIILNDRVIMFHQLSELRLVETRHNNYNSIRGEIILKSGFTTAITKNSIIATEHWEQCLAEIKDFLDDKKLIKAKTYPGELPEAALRDRLWLKTNVLARSRSPCKLEGSTVEGLGGKIDVLAGSFR